MRLIVVLFLLASYSYGQNSAEPKHSRPSTKSQNQKTITAFQPTTIQPSGSDINAKESQETAQKSHWGIGDKIKLALVIITFGLAVFTGGLFSETKKLAQAALDQGTDFKNYSRAELRAYVSISGQTTHSQRQRIITSVDTKPYIFNINIKNDGKTPAEKIKTKGFIKILEKEPALSAFEENAGVNEKVFPVLNPGTDVDCQFIAVDRFEEPDCRHAENGVGKKIFLFGKVIYTDAFGETHSNRFCFVFNQVDAQNFRWFHVDVENQKA